MLIECEVVRLIHTNENFQLLACVPIGEYDNQLLDECNGDKGKVDKLIEVLKNQIDCLKI